MISEKQEEQIGKYLVGFFGLKPNGQTLVNGQILFDTDWGTKTYVGVFRCVESIFNSEGMVVVEDKE